MENSMNYNQISNDSNDKQGYLQKLEARQKAMLAAAQKLQNSIGVIKRKQDLQRKILVGAYYLEQAQKNGTMLELQNVMLSYLQKERDRNLFKGSLDNNFV